MDKAGKKNEREENITSYYDSLTSELQVLCLITLVGAISALVGVFTFFSILRSVGHPQRQVIRGVDSLLLKHSKHVILYI